MKVLWTSSCLWAALVAAVFAQIPDPYIDQLSLSTFFSHSTVDTGIPTGPDSGWDVLSNRDTTASFIFNSVSTAMQLWPQTLFKNGHSIVPASIPTGTILYHGRRNRTIPSVPDWLGFDVEHSYLFGGEETFIYSFSLTRPLRLVYFDGVSAAKLLTGTLDTQDLLIWGRARPDKWREERERIRELCEWGRPLGLDGFVRMEYHLYVSSLLPVRRRYLTSKCARGHSEVMLCDFSQGLEVVAVNSVVPRVHDIKLPNGGRRQPESKEDQRPRSEPLAPTLEGWRGSGYQTSAAYFEAFHAGSWHHHAPGETRVHVDFSRFVTFYDGSLTSLVAARRGVAHMNHRIADISATDLAQVKEELADVFMRDPSETGSGVDWASVTQVIVQRYGARLDLLKHLLGTREFHNATEQARQVRVQLLVALSPHITAEAVPAPSTSPSVNTSWAAPIAHSCATTQTSHLWDALLTRQEIRIRDAIGGTLHEICRVLTRMWVGAFAIEEASEDEAGKALRGWKKDLADLMAWLDWAIWVRCEPACGRDVSLFFDYEVTGC